MKLKEIAFPREYGVWGLLAEGMCVGGILAPTAAGLLLSLAAVSLFCLTHPSKILWREHGLQGSPSRKRELVYCILGYGVIVTSATLGAFSLTAAPFWIPAGLGFFLFLIQGTADLRKQGREFFPEIVGGFAITSLAPVLLVAGGWSLKTAFTLWLLLCLRVLASVTYVRNKVRAVRGKPFSSRQVFCVQGLCAFGIAMATKVWDVPWGMLPVFAVLCLHAIWGMVRWRSPETIKSIGFWEAGLGLFYSLGLIFNYWK